MYSLSRSRSWEEGKVEELKMSNYLQKFLSHSLLSWLECLTIEGGGLTDKVGTSLTFQNKENIKKINIFQEGDLEIFSRNRYISRWGFNNIFKRFSGDQLRPSQS